MAIIYNDVGKGKEREQGREVEIVYRNRQAKREGSKMFHVKQFGFLWFSALPFLWLLRSLPAVPLCCVFRLSSFLFYMSFCSRHKRGHNVSHLFTICSIVSRETFLSTSCNPFHTLSISPHHAHAFPCSVLALHYGTFFIPITTAQPCPISYPSRSQIVSRETFSALPLLFPLFFQFLQVYFLYSLHLSTLSRYTFFTLSRALFLYHYIIFLYEYSLLYLSITSIYILTIIHSYSFLFWYCL